MTFSKTISLSFIFVLYDTFIFTRAFADTEQKVIIDLSQKASKAELKNTLINSLEDKATSVGVYYDFGELLFKNFSSGELGSISISVMGELNETGASMTFICHAKVLEEIDWFYQAERLREAPPVNVITSTKHCQSAK